MKAIIFVQKNDGTVLYKCDTFWTQSTKYTSAKIHNDSNYDVDRLINAFDYNLQLYLEKHPEKLEEIENEYHECKMGFRTVKEEFLEEFSIKEGTKEEDLGNLIYTHEVLIDGIEKPKIIDIRKRYIREEKITEILK